MALISHRQAQEAGLALLKALGVTDLDRVVSFTLYFHCQDMPELTIVRCPESELADKTMLEAAAALAPAVRIDEVEEP